MFAHFVNFLHFCEVTGPLNTVQYMSVVQYFAHTFYFTTRHVLISHTIGRYEKNEQVQQANLLTISVPNLFWYLPHV